MPPVVAGVVNIAAGELLKVFKDEDARKTEAARDAA
jgi:hypothetical protein